MPTSVFFLIGLYFFYLWLIYKLLICIQKQTPDPVLTGKQRHYYFRLLLIFILIVIFLVFYFGNREILRNSLLQKNVSLLFGTVFLVFFGRAILWHFLKRRSF